MKILLLFPMADGQTGPAIKHAFEKLGYIVKAVDAKRQPLNSYSIACDYRPELVFCSRTKELTAQVVQIKREFPLAIICMWNVDVRKNINAWRNLYPLIKLCNYHFVPDSGRIPQWRDLLNRNTFWLPQGLQNEVYDRPKEITDEDRKKYECDVSFAGSNAGFHAWRVPYLQAVEKTGAKFKKWGCDGQPKIYGAEHNKMVLLSKINLCCSGYFGSGHTSVRDYKILGAGGFALELSREGIHEIFPENVIRCYTNPEDLAEKIRYWLDHDEERRKVADTSYRWVHENATYTHRIKMALDYMEI